MAENGHLHDELEAQLNNDIVDIAKVVSLCEVNQRVNRKKRKK